MAGSIGGGRPLLSPRRASAFRTGLSVGGPLEPADDRVDRRAPVKPPLDSDMPERVLIPAGLFATRAFPAGSASQCN